jgi:replication initiation protein RepC
MNEIATTPFGRRSLSLGMVAAQVAAKACPVEAIVHKWKVFQAVCEAKMMLGVSDRALAVLNALLSFHPETTLTGEGGLVVFPSNRHLSLRAHGMAPATLRRHLAVLVETGLVIRRDSPNGKRYARKGEGGEIESAFGFDLTPLVARAGEFERLADAVRAERRSLMLIRERITLYRRDIAKMIAAGLEEGISGNWTSLHEAYLAVIRQIPRTATKADLEPIARELEFLAGEVRNVLEFHLNLRNPSANESQTERHKQNSNPDSPSESELAFEKSRGKVETTPQTLRLVGNQDDQKRAGEGTDRAPPHPNAVGVTESLKAFPLGMVLDACPDIGDYVKGGIRSWRDFVTAAELARAILGISPSAWQAACEAMGTEAAGVVVAAIVQKGEAVKNAGAYLRNLTEKARAKQFSLGPMLMALIRIRHGGGQKRA